MERKQFGYYFALNGILLTFYALVISGYRTSTQGVGIAIMFALLAAALITSGSIIVLLAANDEVELSYVILGIGVAIGIALGYIVNFDPLLTTGYAILGFALTMVVVFFRSYS